ncbi:DUF1269 domain-containing protein [Paraburkholderia acidiphila]|uniref:DUF1269 domain-containing protein n=1 Tax=Paraburkholderia acidiphila TaxID=2571747 RepID=A0A7Z2GDG1_9BURK|nr:DUF1269 domain-containing protein [Paraburkholderia acidiphila]QGZ59732.1 DUF1269 domain-containing protein [Paraburkholderia acidiphila]
MANNLIVAIFNNAAIAEKACQDFKDYAEKGQGFTIHSGVVVEKRTDGKLSVLERQSRSFWGTTIGAATGALIGSLGGPAGSILGFVVGASAGLTGHALRDLLDSELVNAISAKLTPGSAAVILEADEPSPFAVDNVVSGYGGSVHRKAYPE